MFGPTASPVVHCQSTWHIGPTTCVLTSRSFARFESAGSSADSSQARICGSSASIHARERDRVAGVVADEARRTRDPVVRARRCGSRRPRVAPRVIEAVSPPSVCASGTCTVSCGAPRLDDLAVVGQFVGAELDLDRRGRDGDHRDADERLRRTGERLEVDGGDEAAVEAHGLAALVDRRGVVLPGPAHAVHRLAYMSATLIKGKPIADRIRAEVAEEVQGDRSHRPRHRARRRRPGLGGLHPAQAQGGPRGRLRRAGRAAARRRRRRTTCSRRWPR